ncbi:MAG: signal peptidase II [Bacilli bacterium]|nr:signal peptidase II [Bacilli bacterium]
MNKRERIYQITAILLMIDQAIKLLVSSKMHLYQSISIIPHFFSLSYVKNTGAAFSLFENHTILLTIISAIFVVIMDFYIKKEQKNFEKNEITSMGMIMGGIFGNMIDRILHHSVIDYLSFQFGSYYFPVFNFADICIVLGVILLIGYPLYKKIRK